MPVAVRLWSTRWRALSQPVHTGEVAAVPGRIFNKPLRVPYTVFSSGTYRSLQIQIMGRRSIEDVDACLPFRAFFAVVADDDAGVSGNKIIRHNW